MALKPQFRNGKPLWNQINGVWVPAWREETEPCCCPGFGCEECCALVTGVAATVTGLGDSVTDMGGGCIRTCRHSNLNGSYVLTDSSAGSSSCPGNDGYHLYLGGQTVPGLCDATPGGILVCEYDCDLGGGSTLHCETRFTKATADVTCGSIFLLLCGTCYWAQVDGGAWYHPGTECLCDAACCGMVANTDTYTGQTVCDGPMAAAGDCVSGLCVQELFTGTLTALM